MSHSWKVSFAAFSSPTSSLTRRRDSSEELSRLSTTCTTHPAVRSCVTVCEPMYPAPPVTSTVARSSAAIFEAEAKRVGGRGRERGAGAADDARVRTRAREVLMSNALSGWTVEDRGSIEDRDRSIDRSMGRGSIDRWVEVRSIDRADAA
eukprot:29739-Pelagococcus_subviridis.AAC.14